MVASGVERRYFLKDGIQLQTTPTMVEGGVGFWRHLWKVGFSVRGWHAEGGWGDVHGRHAEEGRGG